MLLLKISYIKQRTVAINAILLKSYTLSIEPSTVKIWGQVTGPKGHWSESYIVVGLGLGLRLGLGLGFGPVPLRTSDL